MKTVSRFMAMIALALLAGCGSNSKSGNPMSPGAPIDPSGNWAMSLTDAGSHQVLLSGLFSQTGSVVTALDILAAGNPSPFSCVPFSATFANGQVLNVNQFSGDINTPSFGSIHFASTLNPQGTHADGTYTLAGGNTCWGVAASGNFTADEIPTLSGNWTGTVTCTTNCPAGATQGTIAATLTQDDSTGNVSGTYTISGLPNISSGTVATGQFDVLSGESWQDTLTDNNGNVYVIAGGPFNGQIGLGLDGSFNGLLIERTDAGGASTATYSVVMSH